MIKYNTKGHKIMTPIGYKDFAGIQKLYKSCVEIQTSNYTLSCSNNHPVCINYENNIFDSVDNLKIGDIIYTINGYEKIIQKVDIGYNHVYDILEVEDTASYFTDGILSHNCEFLDNGVAAIDAELFDELKKYCKEPIHILDDGHYKIWVNEPDPSRIYVAGVDISEGVDQDASVIQILDVTDPREIIQVGEYYNNSIPPAEFSNKLYEILQNWGNPLVLIERNNQGGQVCDRLALDFGYENIVSWGAKQAHKNQQFGIISHTNTKYKAVLNQRYFVNEMRAVKFNSLATLNEFKSFIRYANGSWKAKGGEHDDRVMAFIWALMILFNEITEVYFEIAEFDDFGKPLRLTAIDHGTKYFKNPTSIYTNEKIERIEHSNLSPIAFGIYDEGNADVFDLMGAGWTFPDGMVPTHLGGIGGIKDYDNSFDKYF